MCRVGLAPRRACQPMPACSRSVLWSAGGPSSSCVLAQCESDSVARGCARHHLGDRHRGHLVDVCLRRLGRSIIGGAECSGEEATYLVRGPCRLWALWRSRLLTSSP
uniref:Uncharacterized protein n=1 Tax=uncultured marine virus TaxID=186617 RepID=A0A0F7L9C8_9VIRU|nr:hypothetical protein [uncultured marine virus]